MSARRCIDPAVADSVSSPRDRNDDTNDHEDDDPEQGHGCIVAPAAHTFDRVGKSLSRAAGFWPADRSRGRAPGIVALPLCSRVIGRVAFPVGGATVALRRRRVG